MNPTSHILPILLGAVGWLAGGTEPPPCGGFDCEHGGGGAEVGLTKSEVEHKAEEWPEGSSEESPDSWFEYVAVIDCRPPNTPTQPRLEICGFAVNFCEEFVPDSSGPRSWIYRRTVDASGPTSDWTEVAPTCFTDVVPARSGEPAQELTEAMIIEQFHRTQFALPQTVMEPPGNRTLVNLPVYFELAWPEGGFEPQEVDVTTLIGHEVRIRPTLVGATYVTGDGTVIGPTTSLGGPYPGGDITHEYLSAAEVSPYISVEYGGEVSVDGGEWSAIPSTVTIDGPATPLEVLTSTNRLYSNDR